MPSTLLHRLLHFAGAVRQIESKQANLKRVNGDKGSAAVQFVLL